MTGPRTRLTLRVVPGARRAGVVGRHGGGWKVRVTAASEGGAANAALVRFLAETAGVAVRDVAVVAGHTARDKIVELAGITASELEDRLARLRERTCDHDPDRRRPLSHHAAGGTRAGGRRARVPREGEPGLARGRDR